MGYESRLYVVEKGNLYDRNINTVWGEVIAMFELSRVYSVSDKLCEYPETNAYIYSDDGNTRIIEDKYGERLREIPIGDAIKIIEEAAEEDHWNYRRWKPVLGLLKGFKKEEWNKLVVLHYGH